MAIELTIADALRENFLDRLDGEDSALGRDGDELFANYDRLSLRLFRPSKNMAWEAEITFFYGDKEVVVGGADELEVEDSDDLTFEFSGFAGRIPIIIHQETDD